MEDELTVLIDEYTYEKKVKSEDYEIHDGIMKTNQSRKTLYEYNQYQLIIFL